jgi:hypothetical protein
MSTINNRLKSPGSDVEYPYPNPFEAPSNSNDPTYAAFMLEVRSLEQQLQETIKWEQCQDKKKLKSPVNSL